MPPSFVYDANYLIDNKLGIIVDAEGTRANRIDENRACISMVGRVKDRFGLTPDRLCADTAYGSGKTLKALMACGIEPLDAGIVQGVPPQRAQVRPSGYRCATRPGADRSPPNTVW